MGEKLFFSAVAAFTGVLLAIFSGCGLVATMLKPDVFGGHYIVYLIAMLMAGGCGMFTVIYFGEFILLATAVKKEKCPKSSSKTGEKSAVQQVTG